LANDTLHRIYWTNPPDTSAPGAWWNTYARIAAGNSGLNAPYSLGFIAPGPSIALSASFTGGTTGIPETGRSYLFTYIDIYGAESAPCSPSPVVDGPPDATWFLSGLPAAAPGNTAGENYPPVAKMRIYRTLTGASTGAQFYMVADVNFGSTVYTDTVPDTTIVNNVILNSAAWVPPLGDLDGLTTLPGGMLVGFTGNTIHFCEPDYPHAWPVGYDQSRQFKIVGLGVWQQSLMVLTEGFPSTGSGTTPGSFIFSDVQVPEPCIARGSIITDLMGVYYASQNGLVMLNYYGMQNQTLSNMTRTTWLRDFHARDIVACRHRAQYLAINGTGSGFLIDYTEPRMGFMELNTFNHAVYIWNDEYTGDTYIMSDKKVYLWDGEDAEALTYRWISKEFYLPAPTSLGACQISLDPTVSTLVAPPTSDIDNGDANLVLPPGVNALFKLYAGPQQQHLVLTKHLTEPREIFRLPSGFKAFDWQFEIVARVPIFSVELASTMKELRTV
jgi:hypothetical protein